MTTTDSSNSTNLSATNSLTSTLSVSSTKSTLAERLSTSKPPSLTVPSNQIEIAPTNTNSISNTPSNTLNSLFMSSPANMNAFGFNPGLGMNMNMNMNMNMVTTPGSNNPSPAVTTMSMSNMGFGLNNLNNLNNLNSMNNMNNVSNFNYPINQTGYFFPTTQFTDSSTSKVAVINKRANLASSASYNGTGELPPPVAPAPSSSTTFHSSILNRTGSNQNGSYLMHPMMQTSHMKGYGMNGMNMNGFNPKITRRKSDPGNKRKIKKEKNKKKNKRRTSDDSSDESTQEIITNKTILNGMHMRSRSGITNPAAEAVGLKCKTLIGSANACITGKITGKKRKRGACGDFEDLLSERKTDDNPGSITFKTEKGTLNIRIPPPPEEITKYELAGDCCTEEIEEILQPKKRTRYVRGLTEEEKKDRRREQNRNAAARSRARKNAMIAKVIQLHQENLALRNYIAFSIGQKKDLIEENATLKAMVTKK